MATRRAFASLLLALSENKTFGTGPNGEQPTPRIGFGLSPQERKKVRAMHATAAIVLHYGANDWSRAQTAGLQSEFAELGIDVVAITDASFDPRKQAADITAVLALHPNLMVSIPTDPVATITAYRNAVSQGTKLVFMDNVPRGMTPGKDYISLTSADNYGNGIVSAHLMAEALQGHGTIAMVVHEADFFVTRQRREAFKRTIHEHYPQIEIVEETGIRGPDFAAEAEHSAAAMLRSHHNLAGIWAVWDVPAEGVIAAARKARRNDLVITTVDLGLNVAIELARGGLVFGVGAQRPFDQGVAEAELAAYGLLEKPAPPYVALPALPVSKASVLEAWQSVYHQPPPIELIEAAG